MIAGIFKAAKFAGSWVMEELSDADKATIINYFQNEVNLESIVKSLISSAESDLEILRRLML